MPQHTVIQYSAFQKAYDFFNVQLFAGELPQVLVTLQRKPKMNGYFWAQQFASRIEGEATTDELAMNPDGFVGRTDKQILSTLVHEQTHVWQQAFGKPSRKAYHNKEWAEKMKAIGLHPSDTGAPGGKETGQHMTHYIVDGGPFDVACTKLLAKGFKLNWQSRPEAAAGKEKKKPTRAKFTCPECGQNAWAKPEAVLICGACYDEDEAVAVLMKAEPQDDEEQGEAA